MSDNPTLRYTEPVTLRFPEARASQSDPATKRFITLAETRTPSYAGGQLLAGRYRILKTDLGQISGEAELYQCQDELRQTQIAFKLYHPHKQPKAAVLDKLHDLIHPYLLRVLDHGEWQGRFFEVMPYCQRGNLSERLPLNEAALNVLLPQLLEAMRFCHAHGIIHRDIKPSNLLFTANDDVQLADFGISSYLESVDGVTRTAGNLTLDYAAPELIEGHQIGPATDYYALGITLIHALLGRSPFAGLSQNDIIIAHLRGRRPIPEQISQHWRQLLLGLTLNNMEHRWGYTEVRDWLDGHEVPIVPDQMVDAKGQRTLAYPGWPAAYTPEQLGLDLQRFDAVNQLLNGDIRRWIFDNFGSQLADRVDAIRSTYSARPTVALHYLRFTLARTSPLIIANHKIGDLGAFFELVETSFQDSALATAILHALQEEQIHAWILLTKPAAEHSDDLVAKIDAILQRQQFGHKPTILFAIYYLLDPHQPLKLTPKVTIQQPNEVGPALVQDAKAVFEAWWYLIKTRRLDEWLRAINWQPLDATITFLEDVRYRFLEHPYTQTYAVLWRFAPNLPFFLAGKGFNNPAELARAVDNTPAMKDKFIATLENGLLLAWLTGSGRLSDTGALRQFLMNADVSWDIRMEQVLQFLDPHRVRPILAADKTYLRFGTVIPHEALPSITLTLTNDGGGYLFGDLSWGRQITGIELSSYKFAGSPCTITLTLTIPDLQPGTHRYALYIKSNGGDLNIPASYFVAKDKTAPDWRIQVAQWIAPLGKVNRWLIVGAGLALWWVITTVTNYIGRMQFQARFERLTNTLQPVAINSADGTCFIDHKNKRLWTVSAGLYNLRNLEAGVSAVNDAGICQHKDWRLPTTAELQQPTAVMQYQGQAKFVDTGYYWVARDLDNMCYVSPTGEWANARVYGNYQGVNRIILTTAE